MFKYVAAFFVVLYRDANVFHPSVFNSYIWILFSLPSVKLHIKQDHSLPGCEVYGHIRDASVLQVEGEHSYLAQNHHFEIILSGNGMQK